MLLGASSVNAVNVVWPSPSAEPNVAMPTIVTCTGSGVWTVVVSPMLQVAVVGGAPVDDDLVVGAGARPSASRYGLRSGSSIQLPASVGGPFPPSPSPFLPTSWPKPSMEASAAATPSTPRDVVDQRRVDEPALGVGLAGIGLSLDSWRTDHVGARVGLGEQVVEVRPQRVAEHERPGEERHAEEHREERADEPALVGPQVP